MFYFALFVSAFGMTVAYLNLRQSRWVKTTAVVLTAVAMALASACLFSSGPAIWVLVLPVQAVLLVVVVEVAKRRRWRSALSVRMIGLATLTAYGIVGFFVAREMAELRERYPYRSMADSLSEPNRHLSEPLPVLVARHLDGIESGVHSTAEFGGTMKRRRELLEQLHEHTLEFFVNQPGFGSTRMMPSLWPREIRGAWPSPKQPGRRTEFVWSTGDLEGPTPELPAAVYEQTWNMHSAALVDFINPRGFGYFKDRRHVAGFQGHRFTQAPTPAECRRLQTVDLLGLVVHTEPVVYVSEHLPRMDELGEATQRPPDDFETAGVRALTAGEDLFIRDRPEGRRMLGAIRNGKQCLDCHGGQRGDLLGAFSYTLAAER